MRFHRGLRQIATLLLAAILFSVFTLLVFSKEPLGVSAKGAALYCPDTDTFLYEKNANVRYPMASTTKIMTAILAIEQGDMEEIVTVPEECQGIVMSLIYDDIKTNSPVDIKKFEKVTAELFGGGAEVIILGCTELSLIKRDFDIGRGFADAMEILAWNSISLCEKTPRIPFSQLISLK